MKFKLRVKTERGFGLYLLIANAEIDQEGVLTQFDIENVWMDYVARTPTMYYINTIVDAVSREKWADMFWEEIMIGTQKAYREYYNK